MLIDVEHLDGAGVLTIVHHSVGLPAFMKHAALAGQGPGSGLLPTVSRGIGLLLYYWRYLDIGPMFRLRGFQRPLLNDPTELGQFSNIIGRALSDRLAKVLCGAEFTFTYEAAHELFVGGLPVGDHPDFYCSSPLGPFSIESKGRAFKSPASAAALLVQAKAQAQASPNIAIAFGYGAVSYDLYDTPRCLFHDPVVDGTPPERDQELELVRRYYRMILSDRAVTEARQTRIQDRSFWTVRAFAPGLAFEFLVDAQIREFADLNTLKGIPQFVRLESDELFIDSDGIGVRVVA